MDARSSTSSSDGRRGIVRQLPFALIGAIVIIVIAEIALRHSGWPKTLPYEMGRMEYFVAAEQIARAGAAEVCIVGSSRTRESIVVPEMTKRLSDLAGRPVSVASYACSGAYATDFEAVTRRLLRTKPGPRVILIGISERDLIYAGPMWAQVPIFENVDNFPEAWHERGTDALEDLPVMVRSTVGRTWRTLGLREFIRFKLVELATGDFSKDEPSPAEGGLTIWQRSSPTRNLVKNPVKKSRVLERSAAFKAEDFPDPKLRDSLNDLMSACDVAGVRLVFYEVHQSKALRAALPHGFYRQFVEFITDLVSKHEDRFVRLEDLGLKMNDTDMREPSHMSYRGAKRLTQALTDRIVAPLVATERHKRATTRPATMQATTETTGG